MSKFIYNIKDKSHNILYSDMISNKSNKINI